MSNYLPTDYQTFIYYVYIHVDPRDDQLLYIGHGCRSRAWIHGSGGTQLRSSEHLGHLESMTNDGFIASDWVEIIYQGLDKSSACKIEQRLIRELKPRYNKPQGLQNLKVDQGLFDRFLSLREEGLSYKEIGEVTGVSTMTVYRAVNNQTKNVGDFHADEE
jgi:hypothetical protein